MSTEAAATAAPAKPVARGPGWLGGLLLAVLAIAVALAVGLTVDRMNRVGMIALATVPILAVVWVRPRTGLVLYLAYAATLAWMVRMLPPANAGPIGLALDGLLLLMGLRLAADLYQHRDFAALKVAPAGLVLAFIGYCVLEVFNPAAPAIAYGLYGLRITARMVGFFLALYYMRQPGAVRTLAFSWLGVATVMAGYGLFQHHHGLPWQEMAWLLTEGNATTHILHGFIRVFSTCGDAATFGFVMVAGCLLAGAMAMAAQGTTRWVLVALTIPMVYGLALSYARGPVVALVAGVVWLVIAAKDARLTAGAMAIAVAGTLAIGALGGGKLLDRLQTAADPINDASFQVRVGYMATYAPEIAKRPFGYGVNTSGHGARKVSGGEAVRKSVVGVPTDNYYFKLALELGWLGVGLFLVLCAAIVRVAWAAARAPTDPMTHAVALGLSATVVAWLLGAASNDILAQKPVAEFFWVAVGTLAAIAARPKPSPPANAAKAMKEPTV